MKSAFIYLIFLPMNHVFGVLSKRHCHSQGHLGFILCYVILCYLLHFTFRSVIHFDLISVKSVCGSIHVFACGFWLSQPHLLKGLSLLYCITCDPCDYISGDLFLSSIFYFVYLLVCSLNNTMLS